MFLTKLNLFKKMYSYQKVLTNIFVLAFFILQFDLVTHDFNHTQDVKDDCLHCFIFDDNNDDDNDDNLVINLSTDTYFNISLQPLSHFHCEHCFSQNKSSHYSTRAPPLYT